MSRLFGVMSLHEFYTDRGYELKEDSLSPSMEDYLEMIYRLSQNNGYTRVNEVAENLNVKPSSVTKMIKRLYNKNLLYYERYGMIHLTDEGKKLGEYLLCRHHVLEEFFHMLGANEELKKQVERIEHHISWANFEVIYNFVNYLQEHPQVLEDFKRYSNR